MSLKVLSLIFLFSQNAIADCSTAGKRDIPYDMNTRSIEYFQKIFEVDLSEIGVIDDYPGRDGFYGAIAKKVGLAGVVKKYVSTKWPDVRPRALIRYSDECWLFYIFEFDIEKEEVSWERFLKVSHNGDVEDMGSIDPDDA